MCRKSWKNTLIIFTYSTLKASIVKRFNRTLKNDMWKMFTLNGNYKIDELPGLVSDYNACKYHTINMRPSDVISAIAERLLNTMYNVIKIAGQNSKWVIRYVSNKTVFEKDYTPNWRYLRSVKCSVLIPIYSRIISKNPSLERSTSTSYIALLIQTCISWRKYCLEREIMCTSNSWDSIDRTIHGYTKTISFNKILIHVFFFYI